MEAFWQLLDDYNVVLLCPNRSFASRTQRTNSSNCFKIYKSLKASKAIVIAYGSRPSRE